MWRPAGQRFASGGPVPAVASGSWLREDWIAGKSGGGTYGVVGTGTSSASADAGADGVIVFTVTALNDAATWNPSGNAGTIALGSGTSTFAARGQMPTLSNGTQNLSVRVGPSDTTSGDFANGIYFECDFGVHASNNWFACTAKAGVRTKVDTGVAATAAAYQDFAVITDGTTVTFYIAGVLVATISTNVPTALMFLSIQVTKTLGATALTARFDFVEYMHSYTAAR